MYERRKPEKVGKKKMGMPQRPAYVYSVCFTQYPEHSSLCSIYVHVLVYYWGQCIPLWYVHSVLLQLGGEHTVALSVLVLGGEKRSM
jgi:hypothetical protein